MSFMHNLQPWILDEAPWDTGFVEGATPEFANGHGPKPGADHIIDASPADAEGALNIHPHTEGHATVR